MLVVQKLYNMFLNLLFHDEDEPKELRAVKIMYVIQFIAFSAQLYFPMFYEISEHFSKFEIGVIQTIRCFCCFVGPPFWGAVADLLGQQRAVHLFCLVTGTVCTFCIRYVTNFWVMCLVVFVSFCQTQPLFSLLDQTTMAWITRVGSEYGKQRLYGAVGWGIGGCLMGVAVAVGGINWAFNLLLIFAVISGLILIWYIPMLDDIERMDSAQLMDEGPLSPIAPRSSFAQSMKQITTKPDVMLFFVIVLVVGVISGVMSSFEFLFLFNLSSNNSYVVGIAVFIGTFSELPILFHANEIIDYYGTPTCLVFGLLAYGARFIVYSLVPNAWYMLPIDALHSITFGLMWATFTNYAYKSAPRGTEGTMMGLLTAIQNGLGSGIGTFVGGYVYESRGPRQMWMITFLGAPIGLLLVAVFASIVKPTGPVPQKIAKLNAANIARRLPDYGSITNLVAIEKAVRRSSKTFA